MDGEPDGSETGDVDPETITQVVKEYPIECALLYGSQVRGTATADSDVDVAVGFDDGLSAAERLEHRIELTTELTKALDTDAVDVADLDTIRPAVGLSALDTGLVLVGDEETLDAYRERFERETADETHEQRMQRFDDVLDRLEGRV